MDTIIVTGFEPFGDYEFNPTQEMVNQMDKQIINGMEVKGLVLPCTYNGAFERLKKEIEIVKPLAVICTGFSSSVQSIMVETTAHNIQEAKYADANGESPIEKPVIEGAEMDLGLQSNAQKIASILNAKGIPTDVSSNCEYFICNSLMYYLTHYIQENNPDIKNVFLHTPWTDNFKERVGPLQKEKIRMPNTQFHAAIKAIIENIGEI